ncbi:MAG: hypothetical protein M3Y08_01205 [Fibrobacterota bacterium]|nr:hypothetical protein [Fibrobacterota bacterium]
MNLIAMIAGYAALSLVGGFVAAFAWFTLKDKQQTRERRARLAAMDAERMKPAAAPTVYLAYRIVRDRPNPVDNDIAAMLEQIARQH